MSKQQEGVKIHILDKEYLVACQDEEKEALLASAKYLNEKMTDIRESGKVVGIDRIAVMTALNLAHEIVSGGVDTSGYDSYGARIQELNSRIEKALEQYRRMDLN